MADCPLGFNVACNIAMLPATLVARPPMSVQSLESGATPEVCVIKMRPPSLRPAQENQCDIHIANVRFTLGSASTHLPFTLRRIQTALTKGPLSNAEVRKITQLDRRQALWIMQQLQNENLVNTIGSRRGTRWQLVPSASSTPNL